MWQSSHNLHAAILSSGYFVFRLFINVKVKTYKTTVLPIFYEVEARYFTSREKLIDDDRKQGYLHLRGNGRTLQKTV
jgi:hypothetical protein